MVVWFSQVGVQVGWGGCGWWRGGGGLHISIKIIFGNQHSCHCAQTDRHPHQDTAAFPHHATNNSGRWALYVQCSRAYKTAFYWLSRSCQKAPRHSLPSRIAISHRPLSPSSPQGNLNSCVLLNYTDKHYQDNCNSLFSFSITFGRLFMFVISLSCHFKAIFVDFLETRSIKQVICRSREFFPFFDKIEDDGNENKCLVFTI